MPQQARQINQENYGGHSRFNSGRLPQGATYSTHLITFHANTLFSGIGPAKLNDLP